MLGDGSKLRVLLYEKGGARAEGDTDSCGGDDLDDLDDDDDDDDGGEDSTDDGGGGDGSDGGDGDDTAAGVAPRGVVVCRAHIDHGLLTLSPCCRDASATRLRLELLDRRADGCGCDDCDDCDGDDPARHGDAAGRRGRAHWVAAERPPAVPSPPGDDAADEEEAVVFVGEALEVPLTTAGYFLST